MSTKQLHRITIDDVCSFKRCRQAWLWSQNLTARDSYLTELTNNLVQYYLQNLYVDAIPEYLQINGIPTTPQVREAVTVAMGISKHYNLWQNHDTTWLSDDNFTWLDMAHQFKAYLWSNTRHTIELHDTMYPIVKSLHNDKYYLWITEVCSNMYKHALMLETDTTIDWYMHVIDLPIAGVIYTLLRKKVPDAPKVLANGTLSQATTQDTTADWYLDAAKTHHSGAFQRDYTEGKALIRTLYSDVLNQLLLKENKYFKRIVVTRSKAELDDSWRQLQSVAKEMISTKLAIYRTEGDQCNCCQFRAPCIEKRKGNDFSAILNSSYVEKV